MLYFKHLFYASILSIILISNNRYRLKATQNKIRIVRLPNFQNAKVIFFNEQGEAINTEYHPMPNIDYSSPQDRPRDRFGRSAWAYTSDAHADVASAHGLPSKRALEIQRAEQRKDAEVIDTLRELESASDFEGEGEAEVEGMEDNVPPYLNEGTRK